MGNANCCFMIIAVAFFSPANHRGELCTFITRQLYSLIQLVRWRTWWIASNLKPRVSFCRKILWCLSDPQTYEQNNCPRTCFMYIADYEFYHGLLNNCLLLGQKVNKHRLSWKHYALTQKSFVNKWFHTKVWGSDENHTILWK